MRKIDKGHHIQGAFQLGLALAAVLLIVSACSLPVGSSPTSSSLTPLQVLKSSAHAMQKLNSVHFETTTNGTFLAGNAGTPATPTAGNGSFNLKGSGDAVLPSQERSQITVNQSINLAEVVTADKVYIQNTKGQWYVLDKSTLQGYAGSNPFAGITLPNMNDWLGLLQHVQIDESTFYVHRTELKFNLSADLNSLIGASGKSVTTTFDSTVDLSKFNTPVTIAPPANAIPTDNPFVISGGQSRL